MIEVKNITKKYGKFTAVDNLNFKVEDHEIMGFLGPNGAGKSTTMNMITGYIEPTKGKIIVNGYDISKTPKKAKRQIGYMPESVPLYNDLTVREFIKYMADLKNVKRSEKKAEIEKVLEETGTKSVENKLIKNISRGYKQRVSMAGALIGNPDILILDEPTVGLDPKQITEIRNLIKKLGKTHTIILSSHILSEVSQICNKVIIINKGKILAIDTPENLEKQTQSENNIIITVEDSKNKMKTIKEIIPEIKEIKLIKDNNDGTKQYLITSEKEVDLRKKIFEELPKQEITIFELKQTETTLEDAFLKLINSKETEIKAKQDKEEKAKQAREEQLKNMTKEERKKSIKEEKKKEKAQRKAEFDAEWEKEKQLAKEEKAERKARKQAKKANKKSKKESKTKEIKRLTAPEEKEKAESKKTTNNTKNNKKQKKNKGGKK
ncbi:aBC transporter related protein [Clostridium sp. CAG:793]|nr:aBC transporter related protein [Clostridium sp. CAG:793]